MNSAARILHQRASQSFFPSLAFSSSRPLILSIFFLMIFLSSLSIVYVTHSTRTLHSMLHHSISYYSHLYADREQLLLNKSNFLMNSKVQEMAEHSLGMVVPDHQWVVLKN